ncbi:DUF4215 domain-containing protein, partial [Candidatus Woesearchaeota archaeon]|nr:DUF4215 domain-containing protein [Candidatus Woesearchaeota archaeon]
MKKKIVKMENKGYPYKKILFAGVLIVVLVGLMVVLFSGGQKKEAVAGQAGLVSAEAFVFEASVPRNELNNLNYFRLLSPVSTTGEVNPGFRCPVGSIVGSRYTTHCVVDGRQITGWRVIKLMTPSQVKEIKIRVSGAGGEAGDTADALVFIRSSIDNPWYHAFTGVAASGDGTLDSAGFMIDGPEITATHTYVSPPLIHSILIARSARGPSAPDPRIRSVELIYACSSSREYDPVVVNGVNGFCRNENLVTNLHGLSCNQDRRTIGRFYCENGNWRILPPNNNIESRFFSADGLPLNPPAQPVTGNCLYSNNCVGSIPTGNFCYDYERLIEGEEFLCAMNGWYKCDLEWMTPWGIDLSEASSNLNLVCLNVGTEGNLQFKWSICDQGRRGLISPDNRLYCENLQWRTCKSDRLNSFGSSNSDRSVYCDGTAWIRCDESMAGQIRTNFICRNGMWATITCGNRFVEAAEQCDDGNTADSDGCSSTCQNEQAAARCGDGIHQAAGVDGIAGNADDEQCDDGNTIENDGCLSTCQNEQAAARCGDGIHQAAGVDGIAGNADDEQCDDGNTVNTDACTNQCKNAECGDGVIRTDLDVAAAGFEVCDDGNRVNTDACTNICRIALCGDRIVRTGIEQCDDGNQVNDDGCSSACQDTSVAADTTPPRITQSRATSVTSVQARLEVSTNEAATCRASTRNENYESMPFNFVAGSGGATHSVTVAFTAAVLQTYYVRCRDTAGNAQTISTVITFLTDSSSGWSVQARLPNNLFDIHFINALNGWAVGRSSVGAVIFNTINGGANWAGPTVLSSVSELISVHFVDANQGWAVGNKMVNSMDIAVILHTSNGGSNWA